MFMLLSRWIAILMSSWKFAPREPRQPAPLGEPFTKTFAMLLG